MNSARLIIDSPDRNSSLLYITGFYCIDPIIYIDFNGKSYGFFPSTEFERAKRISKLNCVYNFSELVQKSGSGSLKKSKIKILVDFLRSNNISSLIVQDTFPAYDFMILKNEGYDIECKEEPFFSERLIKSKEEIDIIRSISLSLTKVMDKVKVLVSNSSIEKKFVVYEKKRLTSEFIQSFILKEFIDMGLSADLVIVAIGDQGCDPHETGFGNIREGDSIIVDIFPRSRTNFYFSDMTRTFCKGKASDSLKKLYDTVRIVQQSVIDDLNSSASGTRLHSKAVELFKKYGYESGVIDGFLQGFIHGTGHGLGLECHEPPFISMSGGELPENTIVTVEPGLYYKGIGGVRIEDTVRVKSNGVEILTDYEKILEIE